LQIKALRGKANALIASLLPRWLPCFDSFVEPVFLTVFCEVMGTGYRRVTMFFQGEPILGAAKRTGRTACYTKLRQETLISEP